MPFNEVHQDEYNNTGNRPPGDCARFVDTAAKAEAVLTILELFNLSLNTAIISYTAHIRMLVYPVQILTEQQELFLVDFVISQYFYAFFNRATHKALHKFLRTAKLEFDGQTFYLVGKSAFVVFATPFAAEIVHNVQSQTLQQNYSFYQQVGTEDSDGLNRTRKQHIMSANVKIQLQNGFLFVNGARAASYTPEQTRTAQFVHTLVCGANWYNANMDSVVEELGGLDFCESYEENTSLAKQLYWRKAVYNLAQSKSALLDQDRTFPAYSILIYTLTHGRQVFDVQKATLSFVREQDRRYRGQKQRPQTAHVKIVLKHGFQRYTIESFTNAVQDDWVVRILDPRIATIQAMLEKVRLKETAEKLRTALQQHVYDFKNGVLRELDKDLRKIEAQALEGAAMTRTEIQQEKSAMRRRAANECTFLVRDDCKIARYYDKLGIFICGQTHPTPARIILFTGRSYYDILQLVITLCDEASR